MQLVEYSTHTFIQIQSMSQTLELLDSTFLRVFIVVEEEHSKFWTEFLSIFIVCTIKYLFFRWKTENFITLQYDFVSCIW